MELISNDAGPEARILGFMARVRVGRAAEQSPGRGAFTKTFYKQAFPPAASLCSAKGAKEDTSHLALARGRPRAQYMKILGTFLCVMVVF